MKGKILSTAVAVFRDERVNVGCYYSWRGTPSYRVHSTGGGCATLMWGVITAGEGHHHSAYTAQVVAALL